MLARVLTPSTLGFAGRIIEVECDISNGLPGFTVVGLGDKAIDEARDRVRGAIKNSGLLVPPKRFSFNLAPADVPKDGSSFDLPLAVALLIATGQVEAAACTGLFAGELALGGEVRPVRGSLSSAKLARTQGIRDLFVPADNAAEAAMVHDVAVYPVESLQQLYRHLIGEAPISRQEPTHVTTHDVIPTTNMDIVYGQERAKRALEIAAAGGHNLLLSGPPGVGKTLLSKALIGILPPPSLEEVMEITEIHSLAGKTTGGAILQRPLRSPHHTSSDVALIGGGKYPQPGEISLSHRGVLFLDELPEFGRGVLEVLRQPLEDGQVTIARASGAITFPARFMLLATQNPCPCGYYGDSLRECTCKQHEILRYQNKISGPLIDRIDMFVEVSRVDPQALTSRHQGEPSHIVAGRVQAARAQQSERFGSTLTTNCTMSNEEIRQYCKLTPEALAVAKQALTSLHLSARSYMRILKVARTIADLADSVTIELQHISEALQYRQTKA
jgi:magnesium chelatase family protein